MPDSPEMCTGAWLRATFATIAADSLDRGRAPDERVRRRSLCGVVTPLELERSRDELAQVVEIERLRDEIEGPELQRPDGGLDAAVRRDDGHGRAGRLALHPLDELEAVAVGQAHVG